MTDFLQRWVKELPGSAATPVLDEVHSDLPQEGPQAPQLPAFDIRSTHSPPQSVNPASHVTGPVGSPGQTKPMLVTSVQRVVSETPSKQQSAAPYWPPLQHSASLLHGTPKRL